MVLLLIVASMVAPRMSSFFRGRALAAEARRMLSVINQAQSKAVAEGVPVLLWIDTTRQRYGVDVQTGHASADDRPIEFTAEPSLTFEVPVISEHVTSEQEDEGFGFPEGMPAIRFNPDGFFEDDRAVKIIIRQGTEGALEIAPTPNRLGYEIRPLTAQP